MNPKTFKKLGIEPYDSADYLKSDEYIEYVARNTIGLVRQGETLVIGLVWKHLLRHVHALL